jgi:hypothetical protein
VPTTPTAQAALSDAAGGVAEVAETMIKALRPQQTWRSETATGPAYFEIEELKTIDALKNEENLVIIVPSQEETEDQYIEGDENLRSIALHDGKIVRDVFSPMRAKGMEFQRVAIYKFGDYCLKNHRALAKLLVTYDSDLYIS